MLSSTRVSDVSRDRPKTSDQNGDANLFHCATTAAAPSDPSHARSAIPWRKPQPQSPQDIRPSDPCTRQTSNGTCEHRPSDGPFRQIDNDGRAAEATATTPRRAENAACQWIPVLIWRTRVSPDLDRYSAGNCEGIEGFAHLSEPPRDPRHRFAHFLGRTRVGKTDELMAVNRIEVDAGGGRDARLFQHLLGKLETV